MKIDDVLNFGARVGCRNGYGWEEDLEVLEENGRIKEADSTKVSDKAKKKRNTSIGFFRFWKSLFRNSGC